MDIDIRPGDNLVMLPPEASEKPGHRRLGLWQGQVWIAPTSTIRRPSSM